MRSYFLDRNGGSPLAAPSRYGIENERAEEDEARFGSAESPRKELGGHRHASVSRSDLGLPADLRGWESEDGTFRKGMNDELWGRALRVIASSWKSWVAPAPRLA